MLYSREIGDISASIRSFLASIPTLRILRLGDSSQDVYIGSFASIFCRPVGSGWKLAMTLECQLFDALATADSVNGCVGHQNPVYCPNLEEIELIRLTVNTEFLEVIDKTIGARGRNLY